MQQSNLTPLTPEELTEIELALQDKEIVVTEWLHSYTLTRFKGEPLKHLRRACFTIRQCDKRIEELEAQLKERRAAE